jgi:hypothetical protein
MGFSSPARTRLGTAGEPEEDDEEDDEEESESDELLDDDDDESLDDSILRLPAILYLGDWIVCIECIKIFEYYNPQIRTI